MAVQTVYWGRTRSGLQVQSQERNVRRRSLPARRSMAPAVPASQRAVPCSHSSVPTAYRMGRWARLAMTMIVMCAVIVASFTVIMRSGGPAVSLVTVAPGETVFSVVSRVRPEADVTQIVKEVLALNGLTDWTVPAGSVLEIPLP